MLAAFEDHKLVELDNQTSLITLIFFPSNHPLAGLSAAFEDDGLTGKSTSLPNNSSYACLHCTSALPVWDPEDSDSLSLLTLLIVTPGQLLPCQHPDHQPPPLKPGGCQQTNSLLCAMSSSIPSTGDEPSKANLITPMTR